MKQFCLTCGKPIGMFKSMLSTRIKEGKLCFSCSSSLQKAVSLYEKNIADYTAEQLMQVYPNCAAAIKYVDDADRYVSFIDSKLKHFNQEINSAKQCIADCEKDIKEIQKESDAYINGIKRDIANCGYSQDYEEYSYYEQKGLREEMLKIEKRFESSSFLEFLYQQTSEFLRTNRLKNGYYLLIVD